MLLALHGLFYSNESFIYLNFGQSGQTRPVLVKRFVMKDTVEERLTALRRTLLVDKPLAGTAVSCNNTKNEEEKTPLEKIEQLFGGVGSGRG